MTASHQLRWVFQLCLIVFFVQPSSTWMLRPCHLRDSNGRHKYDASSLSMSILPTQEEQTPVSLLGMTNVRRAESVLFSFPLVSGISALFFHRPFALAFHQLCEIVTVAGVWDSSAPMDLVRTGLNGPVVTTTAILFGTLVANTISILLERNSDIHKTAIALCEQVRTTRIYFDSFPENYRLEANDRMDDFTNAWISTFCSNQATIVTLRQLTPLLEDCTRVVHKVNTQHPSSHAVDQTYQSLALLRTHQSQLMALLQRKFPWFHYANLTVLAVSICVMFLIETDVAANSSVTMVAEPQLALSWSILIGALSMLLVVISDLSNPFVGITRLIYATDELSMEAITEYIRGWHRDERKSTS